MTRGLRALWTDEAGATSVEYAIIIAGIAAVLIVVVVSLGGKVRGLFAPTEAEFPTQGGP